MSNRRKGIVFTNLYPNTVEKNRGVFVRQETMALARHFDLRAISPLPWVPPLLRQSSRYAFHTAADRQVLDGIDVHYPRHLVIPRLGRSLYGRLMLWGVEKRFRAMVAEQRPQFVMAHYAYPDGWAAVQLGRRLGLPVVIKVRGSDINVYARARGRGRRTLAALRAADRVVAVSEALADRMVDLGLDRERITVIPNGVDSAGFAALDRDDSRARLGLEPRPFTFLFLGHFRQVKGVTSLLEAFATLPLERRRACRLIMVGHGELKADLQRRIEVEGLAREVRIFPPVSHAEVSCWLGGADCLVLPSLNEGYPNVLLEALAASRPVIASRTGGIPEIVTEGKTGLLVESGNVSELSAALESMSRGDFEFNPEASLAADRSWQDVGDDMAALIDDILPEGGGKRILYLHRTQGRGVEGVHIRGMMDGMRALGHEVHSFGPRGLNPVVHPQGVGRSSLPERLARSAPELAFEFLEMGYDLLQRIRLSRVVSKLRPDMVYERYALFGRSGAAVCGRRQITHVQEVNYTCDDPLVRKRSRLLMPLARAAERKILSAANLLAVVSSRLGEKVERHAVGRTILLPNAIDRRWWERVVDQSPEDLPPGAEGIPVIGFVGGFYPWHGIDHLVDALLACRDRGLHAFLLLVGEGPMFRKIAERIDREGLADRALLTGQVAHESIPGWIEAMDICVMPSSNRYGSPMKVFEYMAQAKAVLAPDLPPLRDVIRHGENGWLFNAEDRDDFTDAIALLLQDAARREMLGKRAREIVGVEHTWQRNASRLFDRLGGGAGS